MSFPSDSDYATYLDYPSAPGPLEADPTQQYLDQMYGPEAGRPPGASFDPYTANGLVNQSPIPPSAPLPTVTPGPSGEGSSVGVSSSALNFDTLDRLGKQDVIGKRVAARLAPTTAALKEEAGLQDQIAMDRAGVVGDVTKIESEKARLAAEHDVEQSRLVDNHNNAIAAEEERGRQRVESAMSTHQAMLQDYIATQIDPGQMWKNMTGGEKFGSSMSVFVSAFLGAKGIDTPIMGILDKALDRNIDAQIQNLNKKKIAVDAQGDIVRMVREQSASDLEAKNRLKDMALESGKYAITSQMSQFGSKLAEAKGMELIGKINEEQLRYREGARRERTAVEQAITGQEIAKRGDELRAASESASLKLARDRFNAEQNANKGNALRDLAGEAIFDTSEGATKGFFFRPNLESKEKEMVRDKFASNAELMSILKEAGEIHKSAYRGPGEGILTDAQKARADQLASYATKIIQKEFSGTASSDQESKVIVSMLAPDSLLSKEKFQALSSQMIQLRRNGMNQKVGQYLVDMPDEVNAQIRAAGYGPAAIPQDVLGNNRIGEGGFAEPLGDVANTNVDSKKKEASDSQKIFDVIKSDKGGKTNTTISEPEAEITARFLELDPSDYGSIYQAGIVRDDKVVPLYQKKMLELASTAKTGDKEALDYLTQLASERTGLVKGQEGVPITARFAQFLLDDYGLTGAESPQSYSPDYLQQRLDAGDVLFNRK
jgi:hypothetical protein